MSTTRILFVDDEPRILDGLRRSLRSRRGEWEMSFVTDGAAALELLAQSPHTVVVSDMRMPGMDGAELLSQVSRRHPEVARVVLSGQTDRSAGLRAAIAAHRFLTKPAETESVVAVLEQLARTTSAVYGAQARRIAGGIRSLPALAPHLEALTEVLAAPDVVLSGVARIASRDVGLTAKLLQLSNSAFFSARGRAASVDRAISDLGLPTVQALLGSCQALWSSADLGPAGEQELHVTWRHAVATASLVSSIASPANRPYAQAAALLQDVGRYARLAVMGREVDPAGPAGPPHVDDVPDRDIGVELLHLWNLPAPVVAAVAQRDDEHRPDPSGLGVAAAVRLGHLLIQETASCDPSDGSHPGELARLLSHPQLAAHPADWRRAAQQASEQAGRWRPTEAMTESRGGLTPPS